MKGGRVKNSERMQEKEQDKAEAKFAVELRQTIRELVYAEHEHKRKEKEAKERMNRHEMESRKTFCFSIAHPTLIYTQRPSSRSFWFSLLSSLSISFPLFLYLYLCLSIANPTLI